MKIVVAPHGDEVLALEAQLWAEVNARLLAENARLASVLPTWDGPFRAAWEKAANEAISRHLLDVEMLRAAAWRAPAEAC